MQLLLSQRSMPSALILLQLLATVLSVWPSCFVSVEATDRMVCASVCGYATVEAALSDVSGSATIIVAPGIYNHASTSVIHSNIVLNLLGDVTINAPAINYWVSVISGGLVVANFSSGSLTVVGGGIKVTNSNFTLHSPLIITNGATGIVLKEASFEQQGDITANMTSDVELIKLDGSMWVQNGHLHFNCSDKLTSYKAIVNQNDSVWEQKGGVYIECGNNCTAVTLSTGCRWAQSGTFTANLMSNNLGSYSTGVFLDSDVSWSVGGTASISISSRGSGVNNERNGNLTVSGGTLFIGATSDSNYAIEYPAEVQCCSSCPSNYNFTWNDQGFHSSAADSQPYNLSCASTSPSPSPSASSLPSLSPSSPPSPPPPSPSPSPSPSSSPSPSPSPSSSSSPSSSPSPSPSPGYFQSSTTKDAVMPVLRFNYTAPQLVILPKDGGGKVETRAAVGVALEAVVEVASSRDSTTLASAFCVNGTWNATDESNVIAGASQSFTYSCLLVSDDDSTASDAVTMEMQFDLFDTTTNVALHDLVNLTMTPSLTKFSLRMRGRWPWRSSESRLQLRMAINPTFSRAVLVETVNGATASSNGSSSAPLSKRTAEETVTRATTWRLEGQKAAEGLKRSVATLVRLVNVVDLDGETRVGDEWISFALQPPTMNKSSSEMVVSFGQFNESLSYDPDLGVILGRGGKSDESGGDDNTAVIIGVSVAVPLAILVVVIVVAAGAAMFWFRRDNAVRYHYDHQL